MGLAGRHSFGWAACIAAIALLGGCGFARDGGDKEHATPEPAATEAATAPTLESPAPTQGANLDMQPGGAAEQSAKPAVEPHGLPEKAEGCPAGMVRVEGEYCPVVFEQCLEHHPEWEKRKGEPGVAERCLRYASPTKCMSKQRVPMSFCMDRYEYPNSPGEMPRVLTSWEQAKATCEGEGKRLCTQPEFEFACEGPDMLPYVYGYDRNTEMCNQDKDYRFPDHSKRLLHYDECLQDPWCAAELERLDQRERIGERNSCVSWAGVYDLNGNVNEWVVRPGEKAPERSGLVGGWWGPIRSRCRAVTTFHKESDYGYEVGFRCCSDTEKP